MLQMSGLKRNRANHHHKKAHFVRLQRTPASGETLESPCGRGYLLMVLYGRAA
jgi:hypothetical protein